MGDEQPVILPVGTEQEVLYQRLCDHVRIGLRHGLVQEQTVAAGMDAIAGMAVTGVLRALRVMSGRQVAVLLAAEADRRAGYSISEPPRYTAEEIDNVS